MTKSKKNVDGKIPKMTVLFSNCSFNTGSSSSPPPSLVGLCNLHPRLCLQNHSLFNGDKTRFTCGLGAIKIISEVAPTLGLNRREKP